MPPACGLSLIANKSFVLFCSDKPSKQFRNRSDWRYTLTVINPFDLVIATSVVMREEYLLEYSSD